MLFTLTFVLDLLHNTQEMNDYWLAALLSGQDVGLWPADFPCPAPDLWLSCDHFVGSVNYGSAD